DRFTKLIRWLGSQIKEVAPYQLFRTASDSLAVFMPNMDKKQALALAHKLKQNVLDPVIQQEEIPEGFQFGVGIVPFDPNLDEEAVLLAGSERLRRSILDGGEPST
ncbi:MAG: hypothetical protein HQL67_11455, partial [Magnetococcales bacterium]|nr:hypothetical protein [Magnetococcales bacterium]